jgi:nitrogen fixation-related uncharacterized protein
MSDTEAVIVIVIAVAAMLAAVGLVARLWKAENDG